MKTTISEPKPISPQEAVVALRRERRNRHVEEAPVTPSQTGLAIASLSVGVLVAISAVPAGILLAEKAAPTLVSMLAFACIALIMGVIGRRNAMGVAGIALASIAIVETALVYGYISHQAEMERLKEVAVQKEKTAQERARTSLAEAERRMAEIQFEQKKKKLEAEIATANAMKAKLEVEERIRTDKEFKITKEQEAIVSAAKSRLVEDERVMQQWKDDQAEKKAEEERKSAEQHSVATRKRADRVLIGKMTLLYPTLMDEYQKACSIIDEFRVQKEQMDKDIRTFDQRISNAESILRRLIQDGDGPQREKLMSDIRLWSSLREKAQDKLMNQQELPATVEYDLSPSSDWRTPRLARIDRGAAPAEVYKMTGENLSSLHRALRAALKEYPYDGTAEDIQALMVTGAKMLAPTRRIQDSRTSGIRLRVSSKAMEIPETP